MLIENLTHNGLYRFVSNPSVGNPLRATKNLMFIVQDEKVGPLSAIVLADAAAGSSVTVVPARGGMVTSFFAAGSERLYLDEATLFDPSQNVRGGIPVLFPCPGKLEGDRFAFEGKTGSMKQHGFARTLPFVELGREASGHASVELQLTDTEATRAMFPWAFSFRLRYALRESELSISAEVQNQGASPMPFALGYHPYFLVQDADKSACAIPSLATRAWDNVKKTEVPFFPVDLSVGEVDLHLVDHNSNGATLETPKGDIHMGGHFAHWVIWTLPGKNFVCLEPWSAQRNALNAERERTVLEPGEIRKFAISILVR
jgi:galactose mutarotase-like enzyme